MPNMAQNQARTQPAHPAILRQVLLLGSAGGTSKAGHFGQSILLKRVIPSDGGVPQRGATAREEPRGCLYNDADSGNFLDALSL